MITSRCVSVGVKSWTVWYTVCGCVLQTEFQEFALVATPGGVTSNTGVVRLRETTSTHSTQELHMEGVLCEEFFKMREAIYAMHSAV